MELLKLDEIQFSTQDIVFKESPLNHFIAVIVFIAIEVALFAGYKFGKLPLFGLILTCLFFLIFLAFSFNSLKKSLASTNWLFVIGPDRILIKFRSFLNSELPESDPQIVLLKYSEIKTAQIIKARIHYYSLNNKKTMQFRKYLDLCVNSENLYQLEERLKYERDAKIIRQTRIGKSSTKTGHYPVSIKGPNIIRILWSNITPNINQVINLLSRQKITLIPARKEILDYTANTVKNYKNPDDKILELVEHGKKIAAIRLAQKLYGYNTTQAKQFVESLIK